MRPQSRLAVIVSLMILILTAGSALADLDFAVKLRTGDVYTTTNKTAMPASAGLVDKHILIQFNGPVTDQEKARLTTLGIEVLDYVPYYAYTARVTRAFDASKLDAYRVRWYGEIKADYKISPYITEVGIKPWARRGGDLVQYTIVLHRDEDIDFWSTELQAQLGAQIVGQERTTNAIELIIPEPSFYRLSELDAIVWIEPAPPDPIEYNNSARVNTNAEVAQAAPMNLSGLGVSVAEWDGGGVDGNHNDFGRRVTSMDGAAIATHATHVAGTVLGSGSESGGTYRGMAPEAELLSYLWWGSASSAFNQYSNVINNYNATISTNSWGYGVGNPATQAACEATLGNYYSEDATLDNLVRGSAGEPIVICWAAGNQRGSSSSYCGSIGWTYNTVDPLASSKNVITVGAINSNNSSMTSFSSWGPTDDGRIKPDVVGPGCQSNDDGGLTSTRPGSGYTVLCGTSMATPAVAGVVALVRESWDLHFAPSNPLSSTIKGVLINTAIDLGNVGPDFANGHGKVDAVAACNKIAVGGPSYQENQISTGQTQVYDLTVPSGAAKVKLTLVWDDPGGAGIAGKNLINDLDLTLVDPFGAEHQPWVLNPLIPSLAATTAVDRTNNVETVELDNPQPGLWSARVNGYNIPNGPQSYSLVFTPDSIYTPGNLLALAVYDNGDQVQNAGTQVPVPFWVSNVGATSDSVHVTISDNRGWLLSNVDTIVILNQFDSSYVPVTAQIPGGLLAGDSTLVTCSAVSETDTVVTAQGVVELSVAAVHVISVAPPTADTVPSPTSYPFSAMVRNEGNAFNTITVSPSDQRQWAFSPANRVVGISPGDSAVVSFTLAVPPEEAHMATNQVTLNATSTGGATDAPVFVLTVYNPFPPPTLLIPDASAYTQSRTPEFAWTKESGTTFRLYVAQDSSMTSPIRNYGSLTDTVFSLPPADSLIDGVYYWAVRLYVGVDSSSLQRYPHRVVVDNTPPTSVGAVSPINRYDSLITVIFTLSGTPPPPYVGKAPEWNEIQVANDSTFGSLISTLALDAFTVPAAGVLPEGRLYWRARRVDSAGNATAFTPVVNFVHDTQTPPIPTPTFPANAATIGGDLVFRWDAGPVPPYERSAEFYFLHVSNRADFADYSTFADFLFADSQLIQSPPLVEGTTYYWRVKTIDSAGFYSDYSAPFHFTYLSYVCGDVDGSLTGPDISDLSRLVDYLFFGGSTPDPVNAASFDCNMTIDISDLTILVDFLFAGGAPLCCP
ncbi:MAG: S8 family serine peptidase [Candidatus Zixiibacteriota bacterium]